MSPEDDPFPDPRTGDPDPFTSPAHPFPVPEHDPFDDEIPTIGVDMLHHERINLEAGITLFPPVTIGLILACLVVYGRQEQIGSLESIARTIETGAMQRDQVLGGEAWRLISAGFMHANGEHLFGNMGMLYILGMVCEHAFGRGQFLFLYLMACGTGSLLAMTSENPMVGASGAIFGLAGAIVSMIYVRRRTIELRDHRVGIVLAIWSVFSIVLGLLNPIVSNSCHLGGLLGGLALGAILPPRILCDRQEFSERAGPRAEGLLALAMLIASAVFFIPHLR